MPSLESFRTTRWVRTFNLVLQAVLFLTFFGGLNYVAKNHPWRFDLTRYHRYSLSPETLAYIKNLQRPVRIIMTVSPQSENPEVKGLIDEYVYATEDRRVGQITKETIDVYQNRKRSEEIGVDQADMVVLLSGDKRAVVPVNDFYAVKNKERVGFRGEQVLTAALLDVTSAARQKIYFLSGHSELRIDDTDVHRGLSTLREQLKGRNFQVETIDLSFTRKVPDDASLVVAVAPQGTYRREEQEMLRQYLGARAGRMILFLLPRISTAALGLDDLLLDWGVLVHNDVIVDVSPENVADNGDLVVTAFTQHPITSTLLDYGKALRLGSARTVVPDPGRALGTGLNVVTLAATSKLAWGERDFRQSPPVFDAGVDTRPMHGMDPADRLGIIVASERLAVRENLPFSVQGGKLVVFGTADLVTNERLDVPNLALFLNTVNWAVDLERNLNVPPRPIERFHLSLSAADFTRLRFALLLALPGGALALGLLVYWTRRA
jgi:hypothetical protein